MQLEIDIEASWPDAEGWEALAERAAAATAAVAPELANPRLSASLLFTDDTEIHALNREWRGKDKPTNVLSFPMVQPDLLVGLDNTDDGEVILGDLVLAAGVCAREAADKGISVPDHATHLIVHGTLHLLGYDHQGEAEADAMEALEIRALASIGLADPYNRD